MSETTNWEKINFDQFEKLFKKKEQIYVGFRDGYTHGYVSHFDINGFTLSQINNPKSYVYDWEHFELICTAGYKVKKVGATEEANLVKIMVAEGFVPFPLTIEAMSKYEQKCIRIPKLTSDILVLPDERLPFKPSEVKPHNNEYYGLDTTAEDEDYHLRNLELKLKINNYKCKGKYKSEGRCNRERFLFSNGKYNYAVYNFPDSIFGLSFRPSHPPKEPHDAWNAYKPENKKMLDVLRKNKHKFTSYKYVYSGDPWEFGFITMLNQTTFQSNDGLLMLNAKAEAYVG